MSVKGAAQGQQGGDANAMSDDAWASLISMSPSSGMSNDIGVRAKRLGSVWAEYGALYRLTATDNVKRATRTFFAKHVTPPYNLVKGASWHRKVNSYEVEAFFYNALAPGLLEAGAAAPVPRPVCVQVHKPKSFVFLLEDVKPAFPRQCDILTYDETLVALGWLAAYHAHFWGVTPIDPKYAGVWETGCYWALATRTEEYDRIPREWAELKTVAAAVDRRLQGYKADGSYSARHRTLVHGDFKAENILFVADGSSCCAVDFQYAGHGYGVRDVAYLLCSSTQESVLMKYEQQLLEHYHKSLVAALRACHKFAAAEEYSQGTMMEHYELSLIDYLRFLVGWGMWGNTAWLTKRVGRLLKSWGPHLAAS